MTDQRDRKSHVPASVYRLQINSQLTLGEAVGLLDYLVQLGVDGVYLSPLLRATSGSDHGYDTVDPTVIDPDRGGEEGWDELVAGARARGLKVIVDIVPNHMGVSKPAENPAWWHVLEHGEASRYARWFDIDWSQGPVVVPILGTSADLDLLEIDDSGARPVMRYHEHTLPIAEGTWSPGDDPRAVADRQHWRLIPWREGNRVLNYRRFFAVPQLAGLRQQDDAVRDETHTLIRRWCEEGLVDGLRVDHPDGLVDPRGYLEHLRAWLGPDRWLVAEKILAPGEPTPPGWPIDGSVGYDALMLVSQALLNPAAEQRFTDLYVDITGDRLTCHEHEVRGRLEMAERLFPPEEHRIARLLPGLPAEDVVPALQAIASEFSVYRTYLPEDPVELRAAAARASERHPERAGTIQRLVPVLSDPALEAAQRFQQLTGAVMAKGVEDTAFYRHARFIALNEVGGDPDRFGAGLDEVHAAMADRQERLPRAMTCLSTHDTKRGEDVRAALLALAELPDAWERFARLFVTRSHLADARFAYFLAQTLVAVGPIDRTRLSVYVTKAMREASVFTSWDAPDVDAEQGVARAIELAFTDPELRAAWDEVKSLVLPAGRANSLSAKLVQLMMPGVPDVYRGTEVWEDSLVDPDNRRPVDFAGLAAQLPDGPCPVADDGRAKQWLVRQALRTRRERALDRYEPLRADGALAEHCLAFSRGEAVVVATRLPVALATAGGWSEETLALPQGRWTDAIALDGRAHEGVVRVAELIGAHPVALLVPAS